MKPGRIGLTLSGGGVRGFAHIGVLKALEARGWRPDLLTGTSMGGIVAAAYASGMTVAEMEQEALALTSLRYLARLLDRKPTATGLIAGDRLLRYFRTKLRRARFHELPLPLGLMAVDCDTGEQVPLRAGDVALAVRATMAFPGVFAPVEIGGRTLVDGGASDNLPVALAREMGAERVVAVDVCPRSAPCVGSENTDDGTSLVPAPRLMALMQRGFDLIMATLTDLRLQQCPADVLIRPAVPAGVGTFTGFTRIPECIAAGEEAVQQHEEALRRIFEG
ncbi:MAG: patatin-like phospholipase family protein [Anaerolineae bacterium]|nr:patatin-like phospholipase family protein [Anaerolineae bacterium]